MERSQTISGGFANARVRGLRRRVSGLLSAVRKLGADPLSTRSRRTLLLLTVIWILGVFDLAMTLLAVQVGDFSEANPLARGLLQNPPALVGLKLMFLSGASVILVVFRRHVLTIIGCWVVCLVYAALGFIWFLYCHGLY
jgi:hypothetical protein